MSEVLVISNDPARDAASVSVSPVIPGVELLNIPAADLHPHPKNPRKYFAEKPLAELAASIAQGGIRVPLIVWPRLEGSGYWILAGERRYRAGKRVNLEQYPCLVRDCSEQEALKILTFENMQREDCHALEEAQGFRAYIDDALSDVATVAKEAGKSGSHVYSRLKLLESIPEAQQACWEGIISANHLDRIARRTPADQVKAVLHCQPPSWDPERRVSVRELVDWMAKNLDLNLLTAPFPTDSADLLPEAGSCAVCPHRVGNMPDFDPSQDVPDACTRRECYDEKLHRFVLNEATRLKLEHPDLALVSELPNKPQKIEGVLYSGWSEIFATGMGKPALIVEGPRAGRSIRVVVQERLAPPAPRPAADPPAPADAAPAKPKKSAAEVAKEKEQQRKEDELFRKEQADQEKERQDREKEREANIRAEKAARKRTLVETLAKIEGWPPKREDVLRLLDPTWLEDLPSDLDDLLQAQGVAPGNRYIDLSKLSDTQAARLIVLVACADDFNDLSLGAGCDKLNAAAKRYGVDVEAIRNQAKEAEGGTRKQVIKKLPTVGQAAKKSAPKKKAAPVHLTTLLKGKAKKVAPKKKAGKKK